MAQGREWDREEVIEIVKPYLKLGYSVNKSCILAEIPTSTFATWMQNDEVLRKKVAAWRNNINAIARKNVVESIKEGDNNESRWWLERKEKEDFSLRQEHTGKDGEAIEVKNMQELTDEQLDEIINKMTQA
jgi:hypothetical protein